MSFRIGIGIGLMPSSARPVPTSAPVNVGVPTISGIRTQGQTVTAFPGTWSGLPSGGYAYQWKRNGSNISGATSANYVLTGTDVGQLITVAVTATNVIGSTTASSTNFTPAATLDVSGTPTNPAVGVPYSFVPAIVGGHGPYTVAFTGTYPPGITKNTTTGALGGTASATGTASGLSMTVTDVDGLTDTLGPFSLVVGLGFPSETVELPETGETPLDSSPFAGVPSGNKIVITIPAGFPADFRYQPEA